jgi:nucleotide-binding universal stress UspA family protein
MFSVVTVRGIPSGMAGCFLMTRHYRAAWLNGTMMFKKILVPTDGSTLSQLAIDHAIKFAKVINASIFGFHAAPEYATAIHGVDVYSSEKFREFAEKEARDYLAGMEKKAKDAGVPCKTEVSVNVSPYRAIIEAAKEHNCDLIFMASHGRRGLSGFLLGSETRKVLTHCDVPVLVYRDAISKAGLREALEELDDFRT